MRTTFYKAWMAISFALWFAAIALNTFVYKAESPAETPWFIFVMLIPGAILLLYNVIKLLTDDTWR